MSEDYAAINAAYASLQLHREIEAAELENDVDPAMADQHVANAILRELGADELQLEADEEVVATEVAQLQAWLEGRREAAEKVMARKRLWLEGWHRAQLGEHEGGRKTIHLPAGTLRSSAQQPEWEVVDRGALVDFLVENAPELVRTPVPKPPAPAPDMAAIKRALGDQAKGLPPGAVVAPTLAEGEVPGLRVVVRGRRFTQEPTRPE